LSVSVVALTVTVSLAEAVKVPLVPLMAMVPEPVAAVAGAVTVNVTLEPVFTLAELRATVTPVGAVAFRATAPE
jgi:hypothetical protein